MWLYLALFIPFALFTMFAQWFVKHRIKKMMEMEAAAGLTGAQVAQKILEINGITDVKVEETDGFLSDHYSPKELTLRLSPDIFSGTHVSALGVAAHEVGHAIQHQKAWAPLQLRQTLVPAAMFGTNAGMFLLMLSVFLAGAGQISTVFAQIGLILYAIAVFFALVTLPVEFDASSRAKAQLAQLGLVQPQEATAVAKVLNAAALTYVAAAAAAVGQLIYWFLRTRH